MQLLEEEIESALQSQRQYFVRPDELRRVWPAMHDDEREQVVRQFAQEHGWRIFTYSRILGAMFVRDSALSRTRTG